MSKTAVFPPIVSALVAAEKILGPERIWSSRTIEHEIFLNRFFAKRGELSKYSESELRNWVSRVAAELNKILKKEGFNIHLDDFGPEGFGVVSILDVMVSWLKAGEVKQISCRNDGRTYSGVQMDRLADVDGKYVNLFEAFRSKHHPHPVALLATKSGDLVGMTIASGPADGLELAERVEKIRETLTPEDRYFSYLKFPMVDLNIESDIGWLTGLSTEDTKGRPFHVDQALQQTKFKMNQFGARVKSAVALGLRCLSASTPSGITINEPFYLWIERPGASMPVMYAYIDQTDWKDPGDLSEI